MSTLRDFWIFSGNSNHGLAVEICEKLNMRLGEAKVSTFSDGETQIEIKDNVRQKEVFVVQSTCHPVNHHVMELLLMIDALKRASASHITTVIPCYGYARQDKKVAPRVPISAKLVADLLTAAGANRIITMDLHASQIQGFFNIPVDNLFAGPVIRQYIREQTHENLVIVAPDAGGAERARAFAKRLDASLALIDKRRSAPNQIGEMRLIGDVKNKVAYIVDDLVDTAGTLTEATTVLLDNGAIEVNASCSHAVLSGPAIDRINDSKLKSLIVTDSIPLSDAAKALDKLKVLSIASIMSEGIIRGYRGDSVTSLF